MQAAAAALLVSGLRISKATRTGEVAGEVVVVEVVEVV